MKNRAFTLIELLVVVLIIGILVAIALPQYQKAVLKSRTGQLLISVKTVREAIHSYELAKGIWPTTFDQIDLDLPLTNGSGTICKLGVGSGITSKNGKDFSIVLGSKDNHWNDIFGVFTDGPYKCTGFAYVKGFTALLEDDELYCVEIIPSADSNFTKGDFCEKVMGKTFVTEYALVNFFK